MSTPESRARAAAYMRDWNAKHHDRLLVERRERFATDAAYRADMCQRTRLIALKQRGGVDDDTERMVGILKRDPCTYCGEQMAPLERSAGDGASVDHIDPAGDSHWTNLAGCCRSCNAVKGQLPLLLSLLERQIRRDFVPLAEQLWIIKGRIGQRRRIDF